MADLIALPRATDAADAAISGAVASFFAAGTTTPLTVYTDNTLATARGTTLTADSEGVFGECWVATNTDVKVDITDNSVSIPGYPRDDHPVFRDGANSAANSSFTPTTTLPHNNVQDAIEAASNLVVVSSDDTDGGYLEDKITVQGGIVKTTTSPAGDERFDLNTSGKLLDLNNLSAAEGDIYYHNGTNLVRLPKGTAQQRLKMNSGATAPEWAANVDKYESTAQTITSAGLLTLAHGLPSKPFGVSGYIKCTTANNGYSVGDEVEVTLVTNTPGAGGRANGVYTDATNINLRFSDQTQCFHGANKSTGASVLFTNSSWELYVRAWV